MSGYGYGPPPPPPSSAGYTHPNASYSHQGQGRGGGVGSQSSRGRGGQYPRPRGDYRGPSQPHYEYPAQPYPPHPQASYSASHPPTGSYPSHPQQWTPEHGSHAPHGTHPHAPAPLSTSNYHPNYVPAYSSAQHPPQPSYGSAQPYGQPYQGHSATNPPHWAPQGLPQPPHYASSRGRGGYGDRGAPKVTHGGLNRRAYEHEPAPPAGVPYGQPYPHDPRVPHYPPVSFPYATSSTAPPLNHRDGQFSQHSRRGRGGGHREGLRGRGGHQNQHHHGKNRHSKQNHNENRPKAETPSVGKKKKRKVNTLGLTPGVESESEDDEGEEKALTDLIGAETLKISDVAAFLAERRKNYPTKSRVEAKKAAAVAQKAQDKTAELERQADKLRRQLRKVEVSIKRKREQGDEGDEMRDPSDDSSGDDKPEVMSTRVKTAPPPAAAAKKADVSRHCKYYSTGGTCGKKGKCRFVHDPEVREAAIKEREANNGRLTIQQRLILNDKEQDDLAVLQSIQYLRGKGLMMSSANETEGMVIPDRADEDREKDGDQSDIQNTATPVPATSESSLLPAPPTSLPPPPENTRKDDQGPTESTPLAVPNTESDSNVGSKQYEGWLLQPYGSSNGEASKTDDLP